MRTEDTSAAGARVVLSRNELLILANTLNLALHSLDADQFAALLRAQKDDAAALWDEVSGAFDGVAAAVSAAEAASDA